MPVGLITNELVSNAVKHGSRGIEKAKVELTLALEDDAVRVTVADDGPGLPRPFEPKKGASLGMLLIEALTRQLRGRIMFDSHPSRGTLTFPLRSMVDGA